MKIQDIFKDFDVIKADDTSQADYILCKQLTVIAREDDKITINGNIIFTKSLMERQADILLFVDNLGGFGYLLDWPKTKLYLARKNKKGITLTEAQKNGLLITTKRI